MWFLLLAAAVTAAAGGGGGSGGEKRVNRERNDLCLFVCFFYWVDEIC